MAPSSQEPHRRLRARAGRQARGSPWLENQRMSLSVSVSPVEVFWSPVTATMSPALAESSLERFAACITEEPRGPAPGSAARRVQTSWPSATETGVDAQKRQAPALALREGLKTSMAERACRIPRASSIRPSPRDGAGCGNDSSGDGRRSDDRIEERLEPLLRSRRRRRRGRVCRPGLPPAARAPIAREKESAPQRTV